MEKRNVRANSFEKWVAIVKPKMFDDLGVGFYTDTSFRESDETEIDTIAITIDMKTGEKYKIMVREFGRNLLW